jgi:hypothetical protein
MLGNTRIPGQQTTVSAPTTTLVLAGADQSLRTAHDPFRSFAIGSFRETIAKGCKYYANIFAGFNKNIGRLKARKFRLHLFMPRRLVKQPNKYSVSARHQSPTRYGSTRSDQSY